MGTFSVVNLGTAATLASILEVGSQAAVDNGRQLVGEGSYQILFPIFYSSIKLH